MVGWLVGWLVLGFVLSFVDGSVKERTELTDFAPAQTTATGVRPSSKRSAETSQLRSPPRWTPPTPPVTKTATPARAARSAVAETVVAPSRPRPHTSGRSRREALRTAAPPRATRSSCTRERPTCGTPARTATVAGVAPCARTTASTASAVSRFSGHGIPCATIVDSSATTGRPVMSAAATSALTAMPCAAAEAAAVPAAAAGARASAAPASSPGGARWRANAASLASHMEQDGRRRQARVGSRVCAVTEHKIL